MSAQNGIHYLCYPVTQADEGRLVRSVLRKTLGLSEKKLRSVKHDPQGILLDDQRVQVTERVHAGQLLRVLLNDSCLRTDELVPQPMPLDILYEDDDLLFVNKPAGLVCHPSAGHFSDSLMNGISAYFDQKQERSSIHLLGRLDKDTSGIVGIAKNAVTMERMTANAALSKRYTAIVCGCPQPTEGTITIRMRAVSDAKHDGLMLMQPDENGLSAVTHYRTEQRLACGSLCSVTIETGRMHQIRFHMSQLGCPLLGDSLYGAGSSLGMTRAALHAGELRFMHPFTGQKIVLSAPLPQDMQTCLHA